MARYELVEEPIGRYELVEDVPTTPQASTAERIAANPVTRFAVGAAAPLLGGAQVLEKLPMLPGPLALAKSAVQGTSDRVSTLQDMQKRGGAEGFDVAGLLGTMASPMTLGASKVMPLASSYLGKVAQGLGLGAFFGGATPVTDNGNFWGTKAEQTGTGALAGGAIAGAIPPALAVAQGGYHALLEPMVNRSAIKGRAYLGAAGDKAAEIAALLKNPKQIVSGSMPTAGEAAASAGSAEFSALQKSASRSLPSQYEARRVAQDTAARDAIRTIGQDRAALEAAEQSRAAVAGPLYAEARSTGSKVDASGILAKVDDLLAKNPGNRELVTELSNIRRGMLTPEGELRSGAEEIASVLDGLKAALSDEKNKFIKGILSDIKADLANAIPGYQKAQTVFAKASEPVNQMQIGQYLEGVMTPPANAQGANLPLNTRAYLEAVRKGTQATGSSEAAQRAAELITKRSTGQPRFRELSDALTPKQMEVVESVAEEFARKAQFEHLGTQGAKAGPNVMDLATSSMEQAVGGKIPNPLNRHVMVFNQIMARMEGKINRKLAAEVAAEMLNPQQVGESLSQAMKRQAANKKVARSVQMLGMSAQAAAAQGAARTQ